MSTKGQGNHPPNDFDRLIRFALLGLGIVLVALILLNLISGPRLRTVSLDRAKLTTQSGQRIILHANQPLAKVEASKVRIEPAAAFSVANSADVITISLKQRLRYNTAYQITVSDVTALNRTNMKSTFIYRFTTTDPAVYYLKRATKFNSVTNGSDQITQTTLNGADSATIFSASKIIDYTIVGDSLVVSYLDKDGTGKLSAVDPATKKVSDIELPDAGTASQLHSSNDGTSFGFAFSSPSQNTQRSDSYFDTLFISDIRPGHNAVPMSGIGGKPISVFNWQFAPDGTSVVAHLADQSLLLIDGNFKHAPVPLGELSSISNFTPGGTKLLVRSRDGFAMLDLIRHNLSPVPDSQIVAGQDTLLDMLALPSGPGYLRHYQEIGAGRTSFSDFFRYDQDSAKSVIFNTKEQKTDVHDMELTPNGQLVMLEISPDGNVDYDGYPDNKSRQLSTKTQIVDLSTGKTIKEVNGVNVTFD